MDSGQLDESGRNQGRENMNIQEVMDTELLTIAPETTLREAAQRMSGQNVGAALLLDAAIGSYLGIITERDLLNAIAAGDDPDVRRVA
jgi:CBS domain-containing protein